MSLSELEKEKLELEVKELKRPWFVRPANLISILSLVFAVYQFQSAEIKKENADSLVQKVEEKDEYLQEKQQKVLAAERYFIEKEDGNSTASTFADSTGRIMDVWAYGVEESIVTKVRKYLIEQGNEVGFGGLLGFRPSWLSLKPTVLYYRSTSKNIAQQIATELEELTGIEFFISRGAGLGVNKEEKGVTFFIHITN